MRIGDKLKKLREEKDISIEELAVKLDIPLGCLKDVEQNKRELDLSLIKKVCDITEISTEYFGLTPENVGEGSINQLAYLSGSVGRKIRKLREERGLTLVDLGRKAGISYTHISEIERGNTCPSLKTITKLANVLDLSVTYFFTDKNGVIPGGYQSQAQTKKRPELIIDEINRLLPGEIEFLGRFLDVMKQLKNEGLLLEDALSLQINYILRQLSKEQKQAVLDYAKFIKCQGEEAAKS